MDLLKLKLPLTLVTAALTFAVTAGGAVALSTAKATVIAEKVEAAETTIKSLQTESQQNRERVLRIEILSEQTNKAVERIERKLDRR